MKRNFSIDKSFQKPKILFVYEDKRVRYLIEELKNKIHLIDVFHVKINLKEPFFWINLLLCALEILYAGIKKGVFVKISRRMLYFNSTRRPNFIKKMSSKIEKHISSMTVKPDLILQWSSMFAPYIQTPKIPFALIIDNYADPPDSSIQKNKLRGWSTFYDGSFYEFQKELYCNAICIFTLSKWCKEGISNEYGIDPKKVIAIGWGPAKKIDANNSSEKEDRTILAVGNDYIAKGFDILLKSAEYLEDFSITIVGKDNAFKDLDVPKNVQIKNYVSDETLINLYSKSELFFIFSKFDPSPHVLSEAQAYGCVIIGYDAYGISESVINNKTGILLKTRNPILVAEEIRKLYQDKIKLKRMRKAAVENYNKSGTWEGASQKIAKSLMCKRLRPRAP